MITTTRLGSSAHFVQPLRSTLFVAAASNITLCPIGSIGDKNSNRHTESYQHRRLHLIGHPEDCIGSKCRIHRLRCRARQLARNKFTKSSASRLMHDKSDDRKRRVRALGKQLHTPTRSSSYRHALARNFVHVIEELSYFTGRQRPVAAFHSFDMMAAKLVELGRRPRQSEQG